MTAKAQNAEDKMWQAQEDARVLKNFVEIRQSPSRLKAAMAELQRDVKNAQTAHLNVKKLFAKKR